MASLMGNCTARQSCKSPLKAPQPDPKMTVLSKICPTSHREIKSKTIDLEELRTHFVNDLEEAKAAGNLLSSDSIQLVQSYKYQYDVNTPPEYSYLFDCQDLSGVAQKKFIRERILSMIETVYSFVYKSFTLIGSMATAKYMCIHDHYIYNLRSNLRKSPQLQNITSRKISARSPLCKGYLNVHFDYKKKMINIEHRHMHHLEKNSTSGLSLMQKQKIFDLVERSLSCKRLYTNAMYEEIVGTGPNIKKDSVFRAIRRAVEKKRKAENPILKIWTTVSKENLYPLEMFYQITSNHLLLAFLETTKTKGVQKLLISSTERVYKGLVTVIATYNTGLKNSRQPIAYAVVFRRVRPKRNDTNTRRGPDKTNLEAWNRFIEHTIAELASNDSSQIRTELDSRLQPAQKSVRTNLKIEPDSEYDTRPNKFCSTDQPGICENRTLHESPGSPERRKTSIQPLSGFNSNFETTSKSESMRWFIELLKSQGVTPSGIQCELKKEQTEAIFDVFGDNVPINVPLNLLKKAISEQMSKSERISPGAIEEYFMVAPSAEQLAWNTCWSNSRCWRDCDCKQYKPCPRRHKAVFERYYAALSKSDINDMVSMISRHSTGLLADCKKTEVGGITEELTGMDNLIIQEALEWCITHSAYSRWIYLWRNWYSDGKCKLWIDKDVSPEFAVHQEIQQFCAENSDTGGRNPDVANLIKELLSRITQSLAQWSTVIPPSMSP